MALFTFSLFITLIGLPFIIANNTLEKNSIWGRFYSTTQFTALLLFPTLFTLALLIFSEYENTIYHISTIIALVMLVFSTFNIIKSPVQAFFNTAIWGIFLYIITYISNNQPLSISSPDQFLFP